MRLPAAGGSVYAYLLDQEIVVFIDSGEFSFDADQVDGIEVDARATIAKGILGEYDVDIYLDFWSPDPTLPLTFKGGAGTAGITTDGKADVDGGSGSITATFGSGRVDVDAGSGALFLGLGSGRSDVKTGAGGGEITGQSGGWGTIYVTHRDRVLLDLGPDYDVQYSRSRPSRWDDCRR